MTKSKEEIELEKLEKQFSEQMKLMNTWKQSQIDVKSSTSISKIAKHISYMKDCGSNEVITQMHNKSWKSRIRASKNKRQNWSYIDNDESFCSGHRKKIRPVIKKATSGGKTKEKQKKQTWSTINLYESWEQRL